MIDFEKLAKKHYEESTPEQRAAIDKYWADEARMNETRREIDAHFVTYGSHKVEGKYTLYPRREYDKSISMRIEDRESHDGVAYEIIQFYGGSTGHEAYRLGPDFIAAISVDDRFWICAGSEKYDGCSVPTNEVVEYLREMRPALFSAPAVSL